MALVKYNDRSLRNLTTVPAAVTNNPGALVHIKTLTASSSGTLSFVDGSDSVVLDSTYPIYKFEFINIHPSANGAEGTAFQVLAHEIGNGNDENIAMTLTLFNPSSSVFVKHFIATNNINHNSGLSENKFVAGYFNTTTALTRVQFKMSSGNIDAGQIKLYGIKDA